MDKKHSPTKAVKLQRTFTFNPALFGIVPMLNVLFLVLVFYSLGSRFILQPGVQVVLPATTFAIGPQRNAQIISLTAAPGSAIYFRDQRMTPAELAAQLDLDHAPGRSVILKADKRTPVGLRDEIMNAALQRGFSVILAGEIPHP